MAGTRNSGPSRPQQTHTNGGWVNPPSLSPSLPPSSNSTLTYHIIIIIIVIISPLPLSSHYPFITPLIPISHTPHISLLTFTHLTFLLCSSGVHIGTRRGRISRLQISQGRMSSIPSFSHSSPPLSQLFLSFTHTLSHYLPTH